MHRTQRPVGVFPTADAAFTRHTWARLERRAFATPEELEEDLKGLYPLATVREQSELASMPGTPKWYVFRDGSLYPTPSKAIATDDEPARYAVDDEGIIREANRAAEGLFGVRRGHLVGRALRDFVTPAAFADALALWRDLLGRSEEREPAVESTIALHRPDRTVCSIYYQARYDATSRRYRFSTWAMAPSPRAASAWLG